MAANESASITHFSNVTIGTSNGGGALVVGGTTVNSLNASSRVVSLTSATALDAATHGNGKYVTLDLLAGFDTTLPAATGSGDIYEIAIGTVSTSNDYGILVTTTDIMQGSVVLIDTDTVADSATGFATTGTSDSLTMNATTTGGLTIGDAVKFIDVASGVWHVSGTITGSGTIATPFAAEVS